MSARVLVVGLDGADWGLIDPLLEAGELPALAALIAKGARAPLESTYPPVTFPAWASFMTGVNPGRHGVLDFTRWEPGTYRQRFISGGARRVPTLFEGLDAAGLATCALSFPGTYPPMRLERGFCLAGFDAPVAIGPGPDFAWPQGPYEALCRRHGPWVYADIDELQVGPGWHAEAAQRLLAGLEKKRRIALDLLAQREWDLFAIHIGETDTAGHHFYHLHDPGSPRRPPGPALSGAPIAEVYREADKTLAALLELGRPEAVLIASDHGMMGASDQVLYLNRALADGGFLRFSAGQGGAALGAPLQGLLRLLPARLKERLFRRLGGLPSEIESRRRLAGIDLAASLCFSEELSYAPSLRLNIRGREPAGLVAPEEADAVRAAAGDFLLSLRGEDGGPVVEALTPSAAVLHGPALDEAPDLYLELASPGGYRYTLLPSLHPGPWHARLSGDALHGGKGRGTAGVHRREGVLVVAGPQVPAGRTMPPQPIGACAGALYELAGLSPPSDLDFPSLLSHDSIASMDSAPANALIAPTTPGPLGEASSHYTPAQEARIAARLRALGYLD